jgi:hypothetical protein
MNSDCFGDHRCAGGVGNAAPAPAQAGRLASTAYGCDPNRGPYLGYAGPYAHSAYWYGYPADCGASITCTLDLHITAIGTADPDISIIGMTAGVVIGKVALSLGTTASRCLSVSLVRERLQAQRAQMVDMIDYFHAQPEEVRRFIFKAMADAGQDDKRQVAVKQLIRDKFGDRYTEQEVRYLWHAALYMAFK